METIVEVLEAIEKNPERYPEFKHARDDIKNVTHRNAIVAKVDEYDVSESFDEYHSLQDFSKTWHELTETQREKIVKRIHNRLADTYYDAYYQSIHDIVDVAIQELRLGNKHYA